MSTLCFLLMDISDISPLFLFAVRSAMTSNDKDLPTKRGRVDDQDTTLDEKDLGSAIFMKDPGLIGLSEIWLVSNCFVLLVQFESQRCKRLDTGSRIPCGLAREPLVWTTNHLTLQ